MAGLTETADRLKQLQQPPSALRTYAESTPTPRGQIEPGNIDLAKRPIVKNADGSISTVRSMSVGMDGKEYLIPTVSDDGKILKEDDAIRLFKKTGRHLGAFSTPDDATAYAKRLHEDQAKFYGR
jgi:hypothetical protein